MSKFLQISDKTKNSRNLKETSKKIQDDLKTKKQWNF